MGCILELMYVDIEHERHNPTSNIEVGYFMIMMLH